MLAVIDTNVLLVSISERSKYHWLYKAIVENRYSIAITHDILIEYEEKIGQHWHPDVAANVIRTLLELPNVKLATSYFSLNIITADPDDNKFVDCAFASNADYIVTNDSDFNALKKINFPVIKVVNMDAFKDIVQQL
ncbi:putative toxin-antitoxin system toxin component, PIN family [Pseudoflavitalea sp. X16]|uniref:putative toxin-antitoxin system toxin component, PIN family n=1 Tax=Paraflavitalea devenefica TaxID=2716334 RepID=UPI001423977C|nr:putative toxin-antitoxin system toxin component, PIN family [Paraflavitalea devenefica]NII25442.1 putative toxin-antitoxin system toxin component, PIN family [Paraflavitalea devenefica]